LLDGLGRVRDAVHSAVRGLTDEDLQWRLDPGANSIGWLAWHLTRVQDDHVAGAAGIEQVWLAGEWWKRFDLPFDRHATGYGHHSQDVAAVRTSTQLLLDYHDAVHKQSVAFVQNLGDEDLERIVDRAWNPPVTLGVRLVSVISDDLQHAGQAAFIRGVIARL
jgi:uncharacterized damage-inducible protein DinB